MYLILMIFQRINRDLEKPRIPILSENQLKNLLEELGVNEIGFTIPESRTSN